MSSATEHIMSTRFLILLFLSSLCFKAIAQTESDSSTLSWKAQFITDDEPVIIKSPNNWFISINENYLDEEETCVDCETFRFLWARTFEHPVLIRFDKAKDAYSITYKIGKGAAGYSPLGLKKQKTLRYSKNEWNYLIGLFSAEELDSLPNNSYFPMTDGTSWIIEYKSKKTYKAHYTNWPDERLKQFGYYLLELTGECFGQLTEASSYAQDKVYLTTDNKIITQEEITIALINHVNSFFEQNTIEDEFCLYPDYILTIKKNGKVGRVKSAYDGTKFFENLSFFLEDRTCRRIYKKALDDLNLSYLDFKDNISFYFTNATWDKEKNQIIYKLN